MNDQLSAQLPYQLTTGVTATREGIAITPDVPWWIPDEWISATYYSGIGYVLPWPNAAEHLRYREGEPYCDVLDDGVGVHCYPADEPQPHDYPRLHRLAAILCDDAEGFRVLYWCINILSGELNENRA